MVRRILIASLFFAAPVFGQQADRRSRDEPDVCPEAGGRYGTCDILRFSPDGSYLIAGGDDKVARIWPHAARGLEVDPAKAQILRWRAWREQRGGIKALAISPDGKRVSVGGYGMKSGTVAILDRAASTEQETKLIALTWPNLDAGNVMAMAFHPDGKRLAFGTADGSLWFWEPKALPKEIDGRGWNWPVRIGKHEALKLGDTPYNFPRLLYFRDADTAVSVAQSGQVLACDVTGDHSDDPNADIPKGTTLFNVNDSLNEKLTVYRAALSPDGQWIAAASPNERIVLRSSAGTRLIEHALPKDTHARSLAWHPATGQLAIALVKALPAKGDAGRYLMEADNTVQIFEAPKAKEDLTLAKEFAHPGRAEAMAFHPKESRLAIAGGDVDQVTLYDTAKPEKPLSVVHGKGRKPWGVALSESGKTLGVRIGRDPAATDPNRRGAGEWTAFDLDRLTPQPDAKQKWMEPLAKSEGWTVEPDAENSFVWYAVLPRDGLKSLRVKLILDPNRDQQPTCYTFVPPAVAGGAPKLIVGHYYGCSLFELDVAKAALNPKSKELEFERKRLYTGHSGEVLSVVAAKDGTWFLTGGADHTVAAYSLKNWAEQPHLGATFREVDGKLTVNTVADGSPAYEAGLKANDVIERLSVAAKFVYDRRPNQARRGEIRDALDALESPKPGLELFFGRLNPKSGDRTETLTTVRQRPLWKWFAGFDERNQLREWIVWMWQGSYYFTTTTHGDNLVGWHVNAPSVSDSPKFYPLAQFKEQYLRRGVLQTLLKTRDVGEALVEALGPNPQARSFAQFESAPIRLAVRQTTVPDEGLDLGITVEPRGSNPDLLPERVELWINDFRYEVWDNLPNKNFKRALNIPRDVFRSGSNQLSVLAFNGLGGRSQESFVVRQTPGMLQPNLLGLAVGINDYGAPKNGGAGDRGFGNLTSAVNDAEKLTALLHKDFTGAKRYFPKGAIALELDAKATRKQLTAALANLKSAKPDDLLIVYLAGHGTLLTPDPKDAPKRTPGQRGFESELDGKFLFCCPDFTPKKPLETSLGAGELFDALVKINCRKVIFLDVCHSGQAAETNVIRRLIPDGQGPFIMAACEQNQLSYEDPKVGHGLFTYSLMQAMGPDFRSLDRDSNGEMTCKQLFKYVDKKLPELLAGTGDPAKPRVQFPICFPQSPPDTVILKK